MFLERLKELREENGYSQKYVAESIKVAQSTYTLYEGGKREPGFETLCELSKIFNVSTDYLLGLDDVKNKESLNSLNEKYKEFCNVITSFKEAEEFVEQLTNILLWLKQIKDDGGTVSDPFFKVANNINLCVRLIGILEAKIEKEGVLPAHIDFAQTAEYLRKSTLLFVNSLWAFFFHEARLISFIDANPVEGIIIDAITSMGVNNCDIEKASEDIQNTPFFRQLIAERGGKDAEEENDAQCPGSGDNTPEG